MKRMAKTSVMFTGLLGLLALTFVITSFGYETEARQIPLIVGIPTLILTLSVLLGETFYPNLLKRLDVTVLDLGAGISDKEVSTEEASEMKGRIGILSMYVAVVGYFIVVYLAGLLIASTIFVLLFLKVLAGANWLKSIVMSAVILGFIYLVLEIFMQVDLFRGILFGGIVPSI